MALPHPNLLLRLSHCARPLKIVKIDSMLSCLPPAPLPGVPHVAHIALQVCPYYGSRRAVPAVDVVLAPYSSVLLPEARDSLGIQLQGSVVVFDEAHNLLDAINGAHSTAVSGGRCGCIDVCWNILWWADDFDGDAVEASVNCRPPACKCRLVQPGLVPTLLHRVCSCIVRALFLQVTAQHVSPAHPHRCAALCCAALLVYGACCSLAAVVCAAQPERVL